MTEIIRMETVKGEGIPLASYGHDILFPVLENFDFGKGAKYAKEFKYIKGDKLMCLYPKSGTHWMMSMVTKLITLEPSKQLPDTVLELAQEEILDSLEPPRVIFTHLKPSLLPTDHIKNGGKITLMLRNPKDVMVSYYYHLKNAHLYTNQQTWDEFYRSFVTGIVPFGSYLEYLMEWENLLKEKAMGRNNLDIQVFFYEDFMAYPKENLQRLSQHLGFKRNQDYLERILKETKLDELRKAELARPTAFAACVDSEGKSIIYRKGVVGDWKNHFTVAQNEEFDKLIKDKLQTKILQFNYGD